MVIAGWLARLSSNLMRRGRHISLRSIAVAYIPNVKNIRGCNPGNQFNANSFTESTRAHANVISHELSEATTDPEQNAWFDSAGNEIGDKCNFQFKSTVTLANHTTWQLPRK
ncbi:MAG: hypothetical protein ACREQC_18345, partial [Candidatus Binataceae bacterium]